MYELSIVICLAPFRAHVLPLGPKFDKKLSGFEHLPRAAVKVGGCRIAASKVVLAGDGPIWTDR